MRKIDYHIAITLDGFISHQDGSIDGLLMEGEHADDFVQSLGEYDTVLMGRKTYEFGFQFGLEVGQAAYPNMKHYIFSQSLDFESSDEVSLVKSNALEKIKQLKRKNGKDIWLCGGGELAGFLLENELIDTLTVKVNPIVFGSGRPLFGERKGALNLRYLNSKTYNNGVLRHAYHVIKST